MQWYAGSPQVLVVLTVASTTAVPTVFVGLIVVIVLVIISPFVL
jgi:hypothetical protein